jgi:hypothetical protein
MVQERKRQRGRPSAWFCLVRTRGMLAHYSYVKLQARNMKSSVFDIAESDGIH